MIGRTKWAILAYRQTISSGVIPSIEAFSHVLGCLKFPNDNSLRKRFFENLGLVLDPKRHSNAYSLLDGFGEYDPRSFAMFEVPISNRKSFNPNKTNLPSL